MGAVAQLYNLDTIDPERKAKAIKYYESINPRVQDKHDQKKNKQIQSYIDSYQSSNIQSAAYASARRNRAVASETATKQRNEPKLKESAAYKKKHDHVAAKREAKKKKQRLLNNSKK